jgi:hypothetical protein
MYMGIEDKMVEHKVIVDLNPDCSGFSDLPQLVQLDLYKDGKWHCSYFGFLDSQQVDRLRSTFEVKQKDVQDPSLRELNQRLVSLQIHDSKRFLEKVVKAA